MENKKKYLIIAGVVISIIGLVILVLVLIFGGKKEEAVTLEELSLNVPAALTLKKELSSSYELRNASFNNENIPSSSLIRYVVDRMKKGDYIVKTIKHRKVICQVTSKIYFRSSKNCTVYVISNNYFKKKQKEYFGTEGEIKFEDFTYKNLTCRNDGSKYYCYVGSYTNPLRHFSVIDKILVDGNKYLVYEYYLSVNVSKKDSCLKYFTNTYCDNYKKEETPIILDDIVKEKGVYYLHTFISTENRYYLKSSSLVMER